MVSYSVYLYGYTYGYAQRAFLGCMGAHMVSHVPLGVHRWPQILSEGVWIWSKCGYAVVSSYSRSCFGMPKWVQIMDSMDSMDSMDMRICRYPMVVWMSIWTLHNMVSRDARYVAE